MKRRIGFLAFVLAVPLLVGTTAWADASKKGTKDIPTFGALRTSTPDEARNEALAWLKGVGKADATSLKAFEVIWAQQGRTVVDRIADTLALGDPVAAKLLEEARDASKPAPMTVPAILKDPKQPAFYRANLGVAYAKALSNRRVFEESLDALKVVKVEQTADPAAYLFHRAVAEHGLVLKEDAHRSIVRLLEDAADAPDRYRMLSVLMALDMQSWKNEKDLGWIARKMDNIERRLELNRGGPQTQKIQKEVVARLDEIIKQLENQAKGDWPNGGGWPNGGQPGGSSGSPMPDSRLGGTSGPGNVDPKKFENLAKEWGKLPPKQRAEALQNLTRDVPPQYRELTESYFRKLATGDSSNP